jgi:hypothetical protein
MTDETAKDKTKKKPGKEELAAYARFSDDIGIKIIRKADKKKGE